MAPQRDGGIAKGNRSITSFFKPFTIPKNRWVNNDEAAEEIIVAAPGPSSAAASRQPLPQPPADQHPVSSTAIQQAGTPRKRGRPRKIPSAAPPAAPSAPSSSATSRSSSLTSAKRGRGRPRKSESQQMLHDQPRHNSVSQTNRTPSSRKRPSQLNINPVTGDADVTPTQDSPYRSASDTPSSHRIVQCVAISSSPHSVSPLQASSPSASIPNNVVSPSEINNDLPDTSAEPQPPSPSPGVSAAQSSHLPNASFSSISTLTTVPASSALSGLTAGSAASSRRIASDGLQAVLNSDSEEDSSDEEFAPVSAFLKPKNAASHDAKRRRLSPEPEVSSASLKSTKYGAGSPEVRSLTSQKPLVLSPRKPKCKNSLADLVRQHESWQISQAVVASIDSKMESEELREAERHQMAGSGDGSGDAIILAAGDDEDRDRMIMALARTEALQEEKHYHFFLNDKPTFTNQPFPTGVLVHEPWSRIFADEVSRTEACISGFASDLASRYPLPVVVTSWMVAQLHYEPDEVLREAYVQILHASKDHHTSISDSCASLSSIYETRSLFEHQRKEQITVGVPSGLTFTLEVVRVCAPAIDGLVPDAPPSYTCAALLDMMLINVDDLVAKDTALSIKLADCIEGMLHVDILSEQQFGHLIEDAVATFFSPSELSKVTRCRAISRLPSRTERAFRLRRKLAMEFFAMVENRKTPNRQECIRSILQSIKTMPEFKISESTDYVLLKELITVLDIAISTGWTDHSELIPGPCTGPWHKPAPPSEAEAKHNAQVDALCARLNAISSKIRDAGTSHLRRVEAKNAIERLVVRLEHTVRARPKPQKDVFGGQRPHGSGSRQATLDAVRFSREAAASSRAVKTVSSSDEGDVARVVPRESLSARELDSDDTDEEEDSAAS